MVKKCSRDFLPSSPLYYIPPFLERERGVLREGEKPPNSKKNHVGDRHALSPHIDEVYLYV